MDGLIDELKRITSRKDDGDDYLSMNSRYVPIKIDSTNFHEISLRDSNLGASSKILFVDGGNSTLFESASFCIGMIRIGAILYSDNKRISRDSMEFYILVKEDKGKYSIRTYPKTSCDNISFDPEDELLKSGIEKCSITRIISVIRRFAEIEYACEHSKEADYVLMDGTLEARYPLEDKYLERLFSTGKACALSKTCTLTTKNGIGITKKLSDMISTNPSGSWRYDPIVINNNPMHKAELYFARFHAKSSHVFRFEIQKGFTGNVESLFTCLLENSNDPVFLGYPYGLIDVDQYARVSEDESRLLQTRLSVKLGKDWNELSRHLSSTNAHSILDKIRF